MVTDNKHFDVKNAPVRSDSDLRHEVIIGPGLRSPNSPNVNPVDNKIWQIISINCKNLFVNSQQSYGNKNGDILKRILN